MRLMVVLAGLSTLLLAGCVSLTPDAARIGVVRDPAAVDGCTALGAVARTDRMWGFMPQSWVNNERVLRRDTAALGGDTLLIRQESLTLVEGPRTVGAAYRCRRS